MVATYLAPKKLNILVTGIKYKGYLFIIYASDFTRDNSFLFLPNFNQSKKGAGALSMALLYYAVHKLC